MTINTFNHAYFNALNQKVNTEEYNQTVKHHVPPVINTFCYKTIHEALATKGFILLTLPQKQITNLATLQKMLNECFGPSFDELGPTCVKAEPSAKFYVNSHLAQPVHTDEAYTKRYPRYVALACLRMAKGGHSIIVPSLPLYAALKAQFNSEVEQLFNPQAYMIKNNKEFTKSILFALNQDEIGISFTTVLREMRCNASVAAMFAFIAQYIHNANHQFRFKLQPGQLLIFDNCKVLHGRTAFALNDGRLLYRYWLGEYRHD